MKLISIPIIAFLVALSASNSVAQLDAIPNLSCPALYLYASTFDAVEGDRVAFNVSVTGGNVDLTGLKYHWNVSPRGRIESAEGTPVGVLDTSSVKSGWATVTIEVGPFRMCGQTASQTIRIRRNGPYSKVDEFWWWFQLHEEEFRAYKSPEYERWLRELSTRLVQVDERLLVRINHQGKENMKRDFIVGYRVKPYDAKVVNDFIALAPELANFEISVAKPQ